MKPILFNADMVRALLDGRKTATRRAVKPFHGADIGPDGSVYGGNDLDNGLWESITEYAKCFGLFPYHPGDILWVRETWAHPSAAELTAGADPKMYLYKADTLRPAAWGKWRPSIHMPKEAARLFLRVKTVRAERLHDMSRDDAVAEGVDHALKDIAADLGYYRLWDSMASVWDSTIKRADLPLYGWQANPWVWVIEFERVSKLTAQREEGQDHGTD